MICTVVTGNSKKTDIEMTMYKIVTLHALITSAMAILTPEGNIAMVIKNTLVNKSSNQVTWMMKQHLIQMQLINKENVWSHPRLEAIGNYLLPRNLTGLDLTILVDKMADNAAKNPYLHTFLLQAEGPQFTEVMEKVRIDGAKVFPDVVSYAMVLNRLTVAMRSNWRVLEACKQVWTRLYKPWNILNTKLKQRIQQRIIVKVFGWLKTLSIHKVVGEELEYLKTGIVPPEFGRLDITVNILEAKILDFVRGNFANAKVALALAKEAAGGKENSCTGAGPTRMSPDGQAIEARMALPLQWADLYQTWNMAFVTNFKNWPYFLAKLLIPIVSGYQQEPAGYMYSRVSALYSHINWVMMGNLFGGGEGRRLDWYSLSLSRNWGMANYDSAKDYEVQLAKCDDATL
eukprot:GFUD01002389.1.p1 GENE.GFUD01002389.1~~GFUD01002389.1.p1  ORF type:complete len:402 (+),score=91.63 GFUD01002389.1:21-1226(+)